MMSDAEKQNFEKLVKEHKFTQETYNRLLHKFDMENIDLESEYTNVIKKVSRLRARQRAVVEDFLILRDMLADQAKLDAEPKQEEESAKIDRMLNGQIEGVKETEHTCACDHSDPNHVCTCENGCCSVEHKE